MNKILISVEKGYLSFSKYNRTINEENLNNTNIIDVKSLKFTEEYINENMELVSTFINLIVLKFNLNTVVIKSLDVSETILKMLKNISNIKYINFKEDKVLTYTISALLLENKNLEEIECYSLPYIMFYKFNKDQIRTRNKILSTSKFLEYNNIKTYSDLFNKERIIIGEYLETDDINPLVYFLENNKNLKKIEFKKYNKKNLKGVLLYLGENNLKKINIIIHEDESTTKNIFEDIKLFDEYNKKYGVNIKIKYSKKYKDQNKVKELNIVMLRIIIITCILIGLILLFAYKLLEIKDNKAIEEINEQIIEQLNIPSHIDNEENLDHNNQEEYISSYYQEYSKVYNDLLSLNSDTIGWLTVNNTKINYPVVQTLDNDYYLDYAYDRTKNIAGWIFADYRNDMDNISKNTIIYGHSGLKGGIMFSTLQNVLKKSWYNDKNNLDITFSVKGRNMTWRIFSIYTIEETIDYLYTDFSTDESFMQFINKITVRSINDFKEEVTSSDKILTLSTCYKDDEHRIVVHAKMIV